MSYFDPRPSPQTHPMWVLYADTNYKRTLALHTATTGGTI